MECSSAADLLRRTVFDYVRFGYYRISLLEIPERKISEVDRIDRKIRDDFDITSCRVARQKKRKRGEAVIVYLRFKRWGLLLASEGTHHQEGRVRWHDLRARPFTLFGYLIGVGSDGKPWVKVAPGKIKKIRAVARRVALHQTDDVTRFLSWVGRVVAFKSPHTTRQLRAIENEINHARKAAGLPTVKASPFQADPKRRATEGG
jgi:hypothetical protein